MLKELLSALLLVGAMIAFLLSLPGAAVLLLGFSLAVVLQQQHYNHVLQKQLNLLAARLAQIFAALLLVGLLAAGLTTASKGDVAAACLVVGFSLLPVTAPLIMRGQMAGSNGKLAQHHAIKSLRSVLQTKAGETCLVLLGIAGISLLHVSPAIRLPQLIAVDLTVLLLPVIALRHDASRHKLLQVSAHNLHDHTLSLQALKQYVGFGMLAAVTAYASYLLTFARHHLDPRYIEQTLPLYHQASTVAMLTLALCAFVSILFERVDQHDRFFTDYLLSNKLLLRAGGIGLTVLIVLIYTPGFQTLFQTAALVPADWLIAILMAALYAGWRLLQRHTRKHTRHAILKLHQEVHKTADFLYNKVDAR